MTFNDIGEIKKAGFTGFKKVSDLFIDSSMLPDNNGVYLVLNADNKTGEFLTVGSGGHFKGKNPNVSLAELKANWVENTKVVYIGKATSLKSRLRQYFGFGQGKNIGHYGGRLIWQLSLAQASRLCYHQTKRNKNGTSETLAPNVVLLNNAVMKSILYFLAIA